MQGGAGAVPGVYTVVVAIAIGFLWRYFLVRFKVEWSKPLPRESALEMIQTGPAW